MHIFSLLGEENSYESWAASAVIKDQNTTKDQAAHTTEDNQHPLQFVQPLIKSLLPPLCFVPDVVLYYHNVLALPLKYLVMVTPNGSNI